MPLRPSSDQSKQPEAQPEAMSDDGDSKLHPPIHRHRGSFRCHGRRVQSDLDTVNGAAWVSMGDQPHAI
eukprot:4219759-Amphidinium_carterae.2